MNSDQQPAESVAHPRVSILVVAGAGGGAGAGSSSSSSRTHDGDGIGRLHDSATTAGDREDGMSPRSGMDEGNASPGPTAIPADEGDVPRPARAATKAGVHLAGLEAGVDTVTPRQGDAVNVTNDTNTGEGEEIFEGSEEKRQEDEDLADDGSDYSYTYEDEDEGQYSGFLIPTEPFEMPSNSTNSSTGITGAGGVNVVASEEGIAVGTGGGAPRNINRTISRVSDAGRHASPTPETNPQESERKQKWREPTRAAVNMSLRAEKEKTGGRRRLASDLYKIMMADTAEAGFSLEPSDEDSMEKWRIKLFGFDEDSNLAKDLMVCSMNHVELEMSFPDQYPFEPPFVRVVSPRFKRQTGFVMSGALCMELLTKDGWNPINDIESVIVSIRSLMVVGDGRLQTAADMGREAYKKALSEAAMKKEELLECMMAEDEDESGAKKENENVKMGEAKRKRSSSSDTNEVDPKSPLSCAPKKSTGGSYTAAEAQSAYDHLSKYHKKEGWDKSGWWSRKG